MKKPRKFKFFNKVLEFQLKNKPDNQKLLILANRFMGELEKQGHDLKGTSKYKSVWIWDFEKSVDISPSGESTSIVIEREEK